MSPVDALIRTIHDLQELRLRMEQELAKRDEEIAALKKQLEEQGK